MKDPAKDLVPASLVEPRDRREGDLPAVGQWYWVRDDELDEAPALGCVVHVGSNYVLFSGPARYGAWNTRVHLDELAARCRPEPDAVRIIREKVEEQRRIIGEAARQVAAVASRLRLSGVPAEETSALTTYRGDSVKVYERELVAAKDESLPALHEAIKEAAEVMRGWMQAEAIPLEAHERVYEESLRLVDKRIAGVELYAGLVEELAVVREGAPAPPGEPVCLFQRRHYMDEECLVNYSAGGMRFEEVGEFDRWLAADENLARILPRPRSVVAFRVRRDRRDFDGDSIEELVQFLFGGSSEKDMRTYLYMRNGGRLARLTTSVDFGAKLFPDVDRKSLAQGTVYAVMGFGKVERLATEGEHLERLRRRREHEVKREALSGDDTQALWKLDGEYRDVRNFSFDRWVPWDQSSVYYDDVEAHVRGLAEQHNRLVLLLQGLLDRSEVFHPHPPYKLWRDDDFARAVELVYDDDRALASGEVPDFLEYQAEVNSRVRRGSLMVGQDDFWARRMAEVENERLRRYYRRDGGFLEKKRYRPQGDPGPGLVAEVRAFSPSRGCTFSWERPRQRSRYRYLPAEDDRAVEARLVVPLTELLCVDAYRPGDYRRFYADPRTRAQYLKWAPLLLRAEEYYAGRVK